MPARHFLSWSQSLVKRMMILSPVILAIPIAHSYEFVDEASLSDEATLIDAISNGEAGVNIRLRYEDARQSEFPEQGGQATTLGTRLSFQTQRYHLFSAFLQLDDVSAIPDDKNYNSGSNDELDDVFIGEPEDTRVTEAWLNYDIANTSFKYGRQSVTLNNGRLVGDDGWHQHPQVFTGLSVANNSLNYTTIAFSAFNRIEQPYAKYGEDVDASLKARVFSIDYSGFLLNNFSIYHLNISEHKRDPLWDTRTTGIHFSGMAGGNNGIADSYGNREGEDFSISYLLEFAKQSDAGDNPLDYSATYRHIRLGAGYQGGHFTIGQEVLGADGEGAFVTPLANMHDFQGYAGQAVSQAIGNVSGGIIDTSYRLSYRCSDYFSVKLAYHDYEYDDAPNGVKSIGSEVELSANYKLENYSLMAKFADYSADEVGEDTRRIWVQAGINF